MTDVNVNKNTDKTAEPPLPKNTFELIGEIIRTLGKYAKIVLIVGGLMGGGFMHFINTTSSM